MLIQIFLLMSFSLPSSAKDFEVFDGRIYNGLYYPLVDNIEWGEQDGELPHMEFHIHQKDKPVGVSVVSGKKGDKPVLWIMYDLSYRGEKVCRHILAPRHFKEGQKLYVYRDDSDPDYDNVYIYSQPWSQKGKKIVAEYNMPPYQRCSDENASNMPEEGKPAGAASASSVPTGTGAPKSAPPPTSEPGEKAKANPKGISVDYDNAAVPFSF